MSDGIPTLDAPMQVEHLSAAVEATNRFCAEFPELAERYGDRGRTYAAHDHAYLFAWAVSAVELDAPELFERNVVWLHDLLMRRSFPHAWFVRDLEIVRDVAVERELLTHADAERVIVSVIPILVDPSPAD